MPAVVEGSIEGVRQTNLHLQWNMNCWQTVTAPKAWLTARLLHLPTTHSLTGLVLHRKAQTNKPGMDGELLASSYSPVACAQLIQSLIWPLEVL